MKFVLINAGKPLDHLNKRLQNVCLESMGHIEDLFTLYPGVKIPLKHFQTYYFCFAVCTTVLPLCCYLTNKYLQIISTITSTRTQTVMIQYQAVCKANAIREYNNTTNLVKPEPLCLFISRQLIVCFLIVSPKHFPIKHVVLSTYTKAMFNKNR